jgi:hypothetical protein
MSPGEAALTVVWRNVAESPFPDVKLLQEARRTEDLDTPTNELRNQVNSMRSHWPVMPPIAPPLFGLFARHWRFAPICLT